MNIFLVGGFLGSGKTTAIAQAVALLRQKGKMAGVVTNDQGDQLVDTRFLRGEAIPVREVTGSCFCCNYAELENSIRSLADEIRPDVVFAESVGSCTDLVATVVNPLHHYYDGDIRVVLSVFADVRSLALYLFKQEPVFRDNVDYIFEKQLEEADILIVNKIDLIGDAERVVISQAIEGAYGDKVILYQNSREEEDVRRWIDAAGSFEPGLSRGKPFTIDYDRYGAGEAELAWLDGEIGIDTSDGTALRIGIGLVDTIYERILAAGYPIGHLKFLLSDGLWQQKISFTSMTGGNDGVRSEVDEMPGGTDEKKKGGIHYSEDDLVADETADNENAPADSDRIAMLINARVQAMPSTLKGIVSDCILMLEEKHGCRITEGRWDSRAPGYPRPTYRMEADREGRNC